MVQILDTPNFYSELISKMTRVYTQHIIVGADLNLVMNKDSYSMIYAPEQPKARMKVSKLMETINLVDIFMETNPNLKRYT